MFCPNIKDVVMDHLEAKIFESYDTVALDASLAAVFLYEHRGYKTVGHGKYDLENGVKLVYEIMEKKLNGDCSSGSSIVVEKDELSTDKK